MKLTRRTDLLVIVAFGVILAVLAGLRREFIGDGIRHLPAALGSDHPQFGAPRWLLFPAIVWLVVHAGNAVALVRSVDSAIAVAAAISVACGIVYLSSLNLWLRADGHDVRTRAAALLLAAAMMPFLVLYSDIAEVQIPAAVAVTALAVCRSRFAQGRGSDGTVIATAGALAVASLVYQAMALAFGLLVLAVPVDRLRKPNVALGVIAVALCIPAAMIIARMAQGDAATVAVLTTFRGERGDIVRASLSKATPLKWAAALAAGPPQAIVGLWKFQGLPSLAGGIRATDADAVMNLARLLAGLSITAVLAWATLRSRDWRLGLAAVVLVTLPVLRNQQYTYVKFYLLWPAIVAFASTKVRPTATATIGALVLTLNMFPVSRHVAEGRARYADTRRAYTAAAARDCFFTADWGPPFWHTWPGSTTALISLLWAADEEGSDADRLTPSVKSCFCDSSRVWTDATVEARTEVVRLLDQFGYTRLPLVNFLYRPADGSAIPTTMTPLFVFSGARQAELCAAARGAD